MFLVATDMGRQQPVNPPAEIPIVPGPKNHMEMVEPKGDTGSF
jgi:hypothetical protein